MKSVALADACDVITDGTHYTPPNIGKGVPFLTVKDVGPSGLDFDGCARISEAEFAAADAGTSAPKVGDVLFSKDGTVGKVHVVETDERFAVLSSLAILRPAGIVDSKFLGHMLGTPDVLAQAVKRKSGSAIRRIILSDLKKVEIPLPPLPDQRRIAAILDHAGALRAKRRQALSHLDELEQAVFLSMFGHDRELRSVSELCELVVDCVNRTAPVVDSVTPYKMLRTTNIRNGAVDTTKVRYVDQDVFEKWNRRATPRRGDVILTREAPVGEAGVLLTHDQVFLGQRLMLYRVDPAKMTPDYLAACFRSPVLQEQFNRLGSGSTVKHLPLPPAAASNFRWHP